MSEVGAELLMEPSDLAFTSLSLAAAVLVMGCRAWTETRLIIRINWGMVIRAVTFHTISCQLFVLILKQTQVCRLT